MNTTKKILLILVIAVIFVSCSSDSKTDKKDVATDYSGVYCLNFQNLEMTIVQTGNTVLFTVQSDLLTNGEGTLTDDTLQLTAVSSESENFSSTVTFSEDGQSFTGPFALTDATGNITFEGILLGNKGGCPEYDITSNGIPEFVEADFTELEKIKQISKFRSGFGHSFTDGVETCRSMKHYYNPFFKHRKNNNVKIFSPVNGTIISVTNDGHGESTGLNNKQIHIRPDDQPAFIIVLFHVDLLSTNITTGKWIQNGEQLGYARLYYEDLDEYATSFDIAVWVNTPSGLFLVSYFETLEDAVFDNYSLRGAVSRDDFIITQEWRDANPLECDGESFVDSSTSNDWVILD